jgi:hypothetical protein
MNDAMQNERVNAACDLSNAVNDASDNKAQELIQLLSALSQKIITESNHWKDRLPYRINLVDIWRPNEASHSEILFHLLSFKTPEGNYEILKSLISFIAAHHSAVKQSFEEINIENPEFFREKHRIDLLVKDTNYAIIVENKVHDAVDQQNQLARYIKRLIKAYKYKAEQIYILYLPFKILDSGSGKEPEEQSWQDPDSGESFKEDFKDRYVNFDFRRILQWLKERVLPNVRTKDKHLLSALMQYIDHLEGRLWLRTDEREMNMSIENIVLKELGLSTEMSKLSTSGASLEKVMQTKHDFSEVVKCLNNIEYRLRGVMFGDIIKDMLDAVNADKRGLLAKIDPFREWQVIQRADWVKPTCNVHFEYAMWANNLSGKLKMTVDVEGGSGNALFLNVFHEKIFPKIQAEFARKEITYRPDERNGVVLARKEYLCDGDSLDVKIKKKKEVVLKAWHEFSFLIDYIDETFQLLATATAAQ